MANEKRLIDANAAIKIVHHEADVCNSGFTRNILEFIEILIEEIPTVDAVEVVRSMWVPVGERLPEPSTYVLVLTAPGYLSAGQNCVVADYIHPKDEKHGVFVMAYRYGEEPIKVTHWMPLPELPREE